MLDETSNQYRFNVVISGLGCKEMNKQPATTIQDIAEKVWSRYRPCLFLENQNYKYEFKEKTKILIHS